MDQHIKTVSQNGFTIIPGVIDADLRLQLIAALSTAQHSPAIKQRGNTAFAMRRLLELVPLVRELADSAVIRAIIEPILGPQAIIARGIFFDKNPQANWKVAWHQDLTIAVKTVRDLPGFTGWSNKAGIIHTQPPISVLEQMLTLRIHLDDADADNGALKVLPGSHQNGRLSAGEIEQRRTQIAPVICAVSAGDILLMRPLILHASSAAIKPIHRRVIHLEFAALALPDGLEWYGA